MKWGHFRQRKPQFIPHRIHYPGLELRIITSSGLLYQADCETMRLSAKFGGANPIRDDWISLLNIQSLDIFFIDTIDVQIRPLPGVRHVPELEDTDDGADCV